jgi:hypothetical protein
MDDSPLQYDIWVEEALRTVIRRALGHVAHHGMPGDHHFYITFSTDAEGVRMPVRLRAHHPEEMTIVLQNQFWDLEVEDDAFSVTLNFSRVSERLRIPFDAVTTFGDPEDSFGLQLKADPDGLEIDDRHDPDKPAPDGDAVPGRRGGDGHDDGDHGEPTGEIITLDAFRKK